MYKFLSIILLTVLLISCGSNSEAKKTGLSIKTNASKNTISLGETLNLSISNPKNLPVKNVKYTFNNSEVKVFLHRFFF